MLEIVILYFLSKKIGALAETKGLKAGPWKLRLVLFWILGEFIGVFAGLALFRPGEYCECNPGSHCFGCIFLFYY